MRWKSHLAQYQNISEPSNKHKRLKRIDSKITTELGLSTLL